jgi:predicted pyridoxine 5'-phosphate oxidase superfamily flavin-nucleotide-binding protein
MAVAAAATPEPGTVGFHEGELRAQRRAGVTLEARRLERMLDLPDLSGGAERFLADRTFAVLTGHGADGRLWTTALRGPAGFLRASGRTLRIESAPTSGDPLEGIAIGEQVGLVAIEFSARRRVRVNGRLAAVGPGWMKVDVEQAYGNCPQYISRRDLVPVEPETHGVARGARRDELDDDDRALIRAADTFFLGTAHPTRGADASHRGGPAGFVTTDGADLRWPDLPGNNMFNSLGNLEVDPSASLLFIDWADGAVLALSGTASVEWPDAPATDGDTGRHVRFTPAVVVRRRDPALRAVTVSEPQS